MRKGRVRRWIVAILTLVVGLSAGWHFFVRANFGTLQPGRIYRSGQMSASGLTSTVRRFGLRSVLNLRGVNEQDAWYRNERAATLTSGATQLDFKMASDQWLSRSQLRSLIRLLDSCDYPILIHCEFGSERTGLVSAITELLRPDGTLEQARDQFSLRYMFRQNSENKVLPAHLDQYEAWLRSQSARHTPERFRRWAVEAYVPGQPSREYWPYNPDPLLQVTRLQPSPTIGARPDHPKR